MNAAKLYADLMTRGVTIAVRDGRLLVDPGRGWVSGAEWQALRQYRDELILLLTAPCLDCGQPAQPTWPPHLADIPRWRCLPCAKAAWERECHREGARRPAALAEAQPGAGSLRAPAGVPRFRTTLLPDRCTRRCADSRPGLVRSARSWPSMRPWKWSDSRTGLLLTRW